MSTDVLDLLESGASISTQDYWYEPPFIKAGFVRDFAYTTCPICLDEVPEEDCYELSNCKHAQPFHKKCICDCLNISRKCPVCKRIYLPTCTTQVSGKMTISYKKETPIDPAGVYLIWFEFPSGTQGIGDPEPGRFHCGGLDNGYFPATDKGRRVVRQLIKAWDARILFAICELTYSVMCRVALIRRVRDYSNMDLYLQKVSIFLEENGIY